MIDNQYEIANAIQNPARFPDNVIEGYKRGANPMVAPGIAGVEQARRGMIRNAAAPQMPGQMPTVVEVERAKLAQQKQLQDQQERMLHMITTGLATLPTRPDMYQAASGGIVPPVVAFSKGGQPKSTTGEDAISELDRKIADLLTKEGTEGEAAKGYSQALEAERNRVAGYKDLDEEKLARIETERINRMREESEPIFKRGLESLTTRRGEKIEMTPEERRQMLIANLGRGARGLFGDALKEDVRQRMADKAANRQRQELLDKEEMELRKAELLEMRGQRKEADEARRLAMQAHRESENLRRGQAQTLLGAQKSMAEMEEKRRQQQLRPELEGLRARRERMLEDLKLERQIAAQREIAERQMNKANNPEIKKNYEFLFELYKGQGMKPEEAHTKALNEAMVLTGGSKLTAQDKLDASKVQNLLKSGDSQVGKDINYLKAKVALQKNPNDPAAKQALETAERGLYGGYTKAELTGMLNLGAPGVPKGANVMKFDAQGNPI